MKTWWRGACGVTAMVWLAGCGGEDAVGPPAGDDPGGGEPSAWSTAAPLPAPMAHGGAATLGGQIYVVGGVGADREVVTDAAFRYDPATDRWETLPSLPHAVSTPAVVVHDGTLLVAGGNTAVRNVSPIAAVVAWSPTSASWVLHSELPRRSPFPLGTSTGAAVLLARLGSFFAPQPGDSTALLPSGASEWQMHVPPPFELVHLAASADDVWGVGSTAIARYVPAERRWIEVTPLPSGESARAVWARPGALHLGTSAGRIRSHLVLGAASGPFGAAEARPGGWRTGAVTAVVGDRLFLIGGEGPGQQSVRTVDVFKAR